LKINRGYIDSVQPTVNRINAPSIAQDRRDKMTNDEIVKAKLAAIEAEKRHKRRNKAAIKIQRFWRKIRDELFQKKLRWKTMKSANKIKENYDRDQEAIEYIPEKLQYIKQEKPQIISQEVPTFELNSMVRVVKQGKEKELQNKNELFLALFKGWKTRRIIRNEHLKSLKYEISVMLKNSKSRLTEFQITIAHTEFVRISRKYIEIFNRLWKTNDWIKRYKYPKRNERSINRSPIRHAINNFSPKKFNPVYEESIDKKIICR